MANLFADGETQVVTLHKRIPWAVSVERCECMLQLLLGHACALVFHYDLQVGASLLLDELRKNTYATLVLVLHCIRKKVQ